MAIERAVDPLGVCGDDNTTVFRVSYFQRQTFFFRRKKRPVLVTLVATPDVEAVRDNCPYKA